MKAFTVPCLVALIQICWMIAFPFFSPGSTMQYPFFVYGSVPTLGTLLLLGWFLTRPPQTQAYRWVVFLLFVMVVLSQIFLLDSSLHLISIFVFQPIMTSTLVVAMLLLRNHTPAVRLKCIAGVLLILVGVTCTMRSQGMNGVMIPDLVWRWHATSEFAVLPEPVAVDGTGSINLPAEPSDRDWPAFRGPSRDGVVRRSSLDTDWDRSPPRELWRSPIGRGWSSFCVVGDYAYTQEQRGVDEVVSCRHVVTGGILWTHAVTGRFEDSSSGPGPRSTPTYAGGRLFVLTATGIVMGLDARAGELLWDVDLKQLFEVDVPPWGFASSPLVIDDQVIVFTGAGSGKSMAAFHVASGALNWSHGDGRHGYSSPHALRLHAKQQVLMASNLGVESIDPELGTKLWSYSWDIAFSPRMVQPCQMPGNALLLATAYGKGTRRLQVGVQDGTWSVKAVWTSRRFKPYFNDFVFHDQFVYGFDGNLLTCLDVDSGKTRWRKRGFGNGQLLLLRPQGVLLVLSEDGMVSLVSADETEFQLLTQFQALEGRTWNHPVISRSYLLVRNGATAACYKLALVPSPAQ